MEKNVSCVISLCATAHDSIIDGQGFATKEAWYDYLVSLTESKGRLLMNDKGPHAVLQIRQKR